MRLLRTYSTLLLPGFVHDIVDCSIILCRTMYLMRCDMCLSKKCLCLDSRFANTVKIWVFEGGLLYAFIGSFLIAYLLFFSAKSPGFIDMTFVSLGALQQSKLDDYI